LTSFRFEGERNVVSKTLFLLPFPPSSMRQLGLIPSLAFIHLSAAVIIPFRGFPRDTVHLSKRNNLTGVPIENGGNVLYASNITLGGTSFSVVLDTGRHVFLYSPFDFSLISCQLRPLGSWHCSRDPRHGKVGRRLLCRRRS
jgi:hypothetical protein